MKLGSEVGSYRMVSVVGSGGMAVVYRAEHCQRQTVHAVKILNASLTRDAETRSRFLEEGRLQGSLVHPNIVPVTDVIEGAGETGLVMPLLRGESLRERLRGQPVAPSVATAWMQQILSALSYVHARGVVHRDLKPSNLFLEHREDGEHVWVMDFGIAKVLNSGFTQMTSPIGTLKYMSPEHIESMKAVDHRTDIYALGVILYEMLCGEQAFGGESYHAIVQDITEGSVVPLRHRARSAPAHLVAAVERAMSVNRADRFASAAAFAAALNPPGASNQTIWVPDPIAPPAVSRVGLREHAPGRAAQHQQVMDGLRLHGARRSYAKQLREFLKEDMALSTAQARTLEARAEALGLSAGDVNAIEKRISRRAMIRARTRLHWQRVIQGLTDAMRALRAWTEPVYRFRAERAAARRKKRGSSAHKASMMTRFSVHVSGDIGAVLEDVFRIPWGGYGLSLQYGIRNQHGGLIQRLYVVPSKLAVPVAQLFGILKWNTLCWHWREAMRESRTNGIWPVLGACLRTPLLVVGGALVMLIRLLVALCVVPVGLVLAGPWFLDFYLRNRGQ